MNRKDQEKFIKSVVKDLKKILWTNLFYEGKQIMNAKSNHYVDIFFASIKYMMSQWYVLVPFQWFRLKK